MYRTTSVLALGLFLGLAPVGALAQTQTDDTATQPQVTQTQPSDSQQSTGTVVQQDGDTQESTDTQQSTETEVETEAEPEADVAEEPEAEPEADVAEEPETEPEADVAEEPEAEPETDVAEEPVEDVIAAQDEKEMLASSLMGASVTLGDESIGTVSDLIIADDQTIKGVVVGVGGFLGIGEKRVALPMAKITIQPTEEPGEVELSTSNTREELEAFEEFKTASEVRAEEEAALAEQQAESQQPPAVPTAPTQPQQ